MMGRPLFVICFLLLLCLVTGREEGAENWAFSLFPRPRKRRLTSTPVAKRTKFRVAEEEHGRNRTNATDDGVIEEGELSLDCSGEGKAKHEEDEERRLGVLLVITFSMVGLLIMFCVGFLLETLHVIWIPEAGVGILVGAGISVLAKFFLHENISDMMRFDPEFFFVVLLPPIIFEAGYNMKRRAFFHNIGAICAYAFVGTTISCFAVGGMVYYAGQLGLCRPIGGLAALVFGALISATDPVTTLAVFQALNADIHLYSLVFGESALNDAVAIVLYRTLIEFQCGWTGLGIGTAFATFLIIFVGSTLIGTAVAVVSSLLTKYCKMRQHPDFLFGELAVICCFPYLAFTLAEGLELSGIVAIMFCGIVMSHYTSHNLSPQAGEISHSFFKLLAKLSESFVFIYLGQALFTFKLSFDQFVFLAIAFAACLIARVLNVYPISLVVNLFRKKPDRISQKCQFVIWFGGLRGAVAFLIAVQSWANQDFPQEAEPEDFPGFTDSDCILCTTLFIAVISIFTMGGPVGFVLKCFKLTTTEEEPAAAGGRAASPVPMGKNFYIDRKYIKPFLTIYKWDTVTGYPSVPGDSMTAQLVHNDAQAEDPVEMATTRDPPA